MTYPTEDKRVVRIRRALNDLPNKELLALNEPAQKLIDGLKNSDSMGNELRFQLGALLLRGQVAAKSDRHYLGWCKGLGLQPRTAQNYSRMSAAFGARYRAFCDLKTTTIYRLAAATEEVKASALTAAADGSLTAAKAASLLKSAPKSKATDKSERTKRFVAIIQSFMPDLRQELTDILTGVNLKEALALLNSGITIFAPRIEDERPFDTLVVLEFETADKVPA